MNTVMHRKPKPYRSERTTAHTSDRNASAFPSKRHARRYWILLSLFLFGGLLCSLGLLLYNNPVPVQSPSFWPVVERRITAVTTMAIAALCQSLATVAFHHNHVIAKQATGVAVYALIARMENALQAATGIQRIEQPRQGVDRRA